MAGCAIRFQVRRGARAQALRSSYVFCDSRREVEALKRQEKRWDQMIGSPLPWQAGGVSRVGGLP